MFVKGFLVTKLWAWNAKTPVSCRHGGQMSKITSSNYGQNLSPGGL